MEMFNSSVRLPDGNPFSWLSENYANCLGQVLRADDFMECTEST